MNPFLYTVAEQLLQRFSGKMHQLAVVFPNRRQSVFFSHYLQHIITTPSFLPQLLTIEELVSASTNAEIADNLTQGFVLYEAYCQVATEYGDTDIPPFDIFYSIGETILKDFREIDSYLVNIEEVCQILYDIEAIDKAFDQLTPEQREFLKTFWRGTIDKGRIQEKFLKLWERLPRIYLHFHQLLAQQNLTTMGAAYRQLAQPDAANADWRHEWAHIAFVGFNAFNKSEETFIKKWNDEGFASLWFDADNYYLQNPQQEAGDFLRRNMNKIGLQNELPALQVIAQRQTPIEIVAAEGQYAQAKMLEQWWQQTQPLSPGQAGILLADETLLLPTLQSLPATLDKVNITMGYPMLQSAVYSLVKLFFDVQHDLQQHQYGSVHHSLVSRWLQHPFCNWPEAAADKLQQLMLKDNLVRVPLKLVQEHTTSASLLFCRLMADMMAFQHLRELLEQAMQLPTVKADRLSQGLCVAAWQTLQQLEPLFATLKPSPTLSFMGSLLIKQIGGISVPFEGEPLQGVQLMGLLESRGLDFDHLIILGASEGSLPRINPPDSFLPDNVRRAFGLPIPEHQDAIFAYVFYRLLHRAKTVTMVYNSLVGENSTGEVSRFMQQLAYESAIPIIRQSNNFSVQPAAWPGITIAKNEQVMNRLNLYWSTDEPKISLSPSAINTYLNCRLQFFFKYIAKLKEPDELEEGVEAAAVGSVVHMLMELLYTAATEKFGNNITQDTLNWMQEHKHELVETAFKKSWRQKEITGAFVFSGELHVVKAIVLQYTEMLLNIDKEYAPFNLQSLEVDISYPFAFDRHRKINLKGYIDRVDEKDNLFRMVDYKTGGDDPEFQSIESLFERDGKKPNKAALQTLIYSWMFNKKFPQRQSFEPALIAVRKMQKDGVGVQLKNKTDNQVVSSDNISSTLQEMEALLRTMLCELFDPAVPFDQTTKTDNCKYCDFAGICGRA